MLNSYYRARELVLACLFSFASPFLFYFAWLENSYWSLGIGSFLLLYSLSTIWEGIKSKMMGSNSEFLAFSVMPAIAGIAGGIFLYLLLVGIIRTPI